MILTLANIRKPARIYLLCSEGLYIDFRAAEHIDIIEFIFYCDHLNSSFWSSCTIIYFVHFKNTLIIFRYKHRFISERNFNVFIGLFCYWKSSNLLDRLWFLLFLPSLWSILNSFFAWLLLLIYSLKYTSWLHCSQSFLKTREQFLSKSTWVWLFDYFYCWLIWLQTNPILHDLISCIFLLFTCYTISWWSHDSVHLWIFENIVLV